jgi:hypothetical protein
MTCINERCIVTTKKRWIKNEGKEEKNTVSPKSFREFVAGVGVGREWVLDVLGVGAARQSRKKECVKFLAGGFDGRERETKTKGVVCTGR